jgi:hypothetical protein
MQGSMSIERMCQLAQVSRAGFYRSLREQTPVQEEMELRSAIQQIAIRASSPVRLPSDLGRAAPDRYAGESHAVIARRFSPRGGFAMEQYVGLDVSQKETAICVIDGEGNRVWQGTCRSTPEAMAEVVRAKAPLVVKVAMETGPLAVGIGTG